MGKEPEWGSFWAGVVIGIGGFILIVGILAIMIDGFP
jgi:hypothetical protein